MATEGYRHLTDSCPQLQGELLATLATLGALPGGGAADARSNHYAAHGQARGGTQRMRGEHEAEDTRRVRPRRD